MSETEQTNFPDDAQEQWKELHEKPLDELSDAEITSKIKLSVRRRYDYPEWVLMFEYGAPGRDGSVCDCLAVNTLPSRNYKVIGFEFKASRSDWLREVRDGQKSDYFVRLADEFYAVAPKGVVEESEVPEGWGYLELKPNSEQLYKLQESDLTEHQEGEPGRRFWVRFVKHVVGDESNYTKQDLKEARSRGYQDAVEEKVSERTVDRNIDALKRKAENWDTLTESQLGFLPSYKFTEDEVETLELAWGLVRMMESDSYSSLKGTISHLEDTIERRAEEMLESVAELEDGMERLHDRVEGGATPIGVARGGDTPE